MSWTSLCELPELTDGEGKYVEIDGFQLAVFLHGGKVFVMDNRCPHAGGNMAGGFVKEGYAVCPWHYWAFGLEDGALKGSPNCTISTYKVRLLERDGYPAMVQVDLPTM